MLYPSIQELLKATAKENGEEKLNKYSVTMATAKCARIITNDYIEQRHNAEKKTTGKEADKDSASMVKKEYRDEKAVKNALREMKEGQFDVYLPGEEGYEDSVVEVIDYVEPKEETTYIKPLLKEEVKEESEDTDESNDDVDEDVNEEEAYDAFDSEELMDASAVFTNEGGYTIEEIED